MTDSDAAAPLAACTLCPEPRAAHRPLLPGDGAGRKRCGACGALGRPHARLEGDARGDIIYLCPSRHATVARLTYDRGA